MPILGMGKDVSRVQVNAGQSRNGAVANVLVVAPYGRRFPRNWRQVGRCQSKGLYAGLFIDANRIDWIRAPVMNGAVGVMETSR